MDSAANRPGAGSSPFSRAPQPRPPAATLTARTTAAPAARVEVPPIGTAAPPATADSALVAQQRSGAQWFFWIAALSLVNSVIAIAGQEWRFIIGLGITQLIHEIGAQGQNWGMRAGVISLAVIGFLGWVGHRAANGRKWAFVLGMIVYGIDGAIFLVIQDWVGVGFHAFALFMIFRGYQAARQLSA